jgi:hypothetical protein
LSSPLPGADSAIWLRSEGNIFFAAMSHLGPASCYSGIERVKRRGFSVPFLFAAMKMKPEVNDKGVKREIWYALGVADAIKTSLCGQELVVTSLVDGAHNPGSLHGKGCAADIRIHDLTDEQSRELLARLKNSLDRFGFDVVFEGQAGATPATTGAHIHIEFDPKPGEVFCARA